MALPTRVSRERQQQDSFDLMRRDFNDMLGRFFGGPEQGELSPYGVDVCEDADHYYVEADLPGFGKEDVDISLDNGTLTILAERREEPRQPQDQEQGQSQNQQGGDYLLRERRHRRFVRSFTLPQNVDEQNVNAKLENGCLIITLNKTEESKPRKIRVQ